MKKVFVILAIVAGAAALFYFYGRNRVAGLPSNFASLPLDQQQQYLKQLKAANAWRLANPVNPYE